ncbi:DUF4232 domain-containing protein [Actinokineospora auranticolor]|uniref:Uncharacterized protein DUF4232 n=1 Tax=Actinokineospora auranticolor TaxID=155976 RepID=A0A2S6GYX5_9PSEU|nr:DUF4232 domain-containing protein [Actinokineospora auranticolor]PPK70452.1 uncharacterized protein DUF4232 [Actinokineospora auranticolor]
MWGNAFAALALAATAAAPQAVINQTDQPTEQANRVAISQCAPTQLSGEVRDLDSGAGQRYATLRVRNTSATACLLQGYGGLGFYAADGLPNPTDAVRTPNPGPSALVVTPGATADKRLHWSVVTGPGDNADGPCQRASTGLRVIPPDGTSPFTVPFAFGAVCSGGRIEHSAYFRP